MCCDWELHLISAPTRCSDLGRDASSCITSGISICGCRWQDRAFLEGKKEKERKEGQTIKKKEKEPYLADTFDLVEGKDLLIVHHTAHLVAAWDAVGHDVMPRYILRAEETFHAFHLQKILQRAQSAGWDANALAGGYASATERKWRGGGGGGGGCTTSIQPAMGYEAESVLLSRPLNKWEKDPCYCTTWRLLVIHPQSVPGWKDFLHGERH